jgi:O-antigen ligase
MDFPSPIPLPAPPRRKRSRDRRSPLTAERVPPSAIIASAAVAIAAPWLAGGQAIWGQAAVLLGIAVVLLIWAPKAAPHRFAVWALFGTLALCAVQFLPAWAGGARDLREALAETLEIGLAPTVSPQPWISLDHTLVLLAGLAWWWWCATVLNTRAAREQAAGAALLGITAFAVFALFVTSGEMSRPAWWTDYTPVGPFPNKNQMADLVATWAIVAAGCAVAAMQHRRWNALFWLAAMIVLGWTTFESLSRGGTLALLAGLAVFALREGVATRQLRSLSIGLSVTLCALALFLAFGGATLERSIKLFQAMRESTDSDFRVLIYRDALSLIQQAPWSGLGLGNFEPVFALAREISHAPVRVLHPESDWLWMAAELGWLAPLLALLFIVPALRNPFRPEVREHSPILDAATIAGLAFLLHGFVDVSGHRMGSAIPGLFLLGLGVRGNAASPAKAWLPWFFRAAAVAILVLGVSWFPWSPKGLAEPGRARLALARQVAMALNAAHRYPAAEQLSTAALQHAPLDWEFYFIRAVAELYQEKADPAMHDFRRARQLESSDPAGPLQEGRLWAYFNPDCCREAWEAALSRGQGAAATGIFREIAALGVTYPDLLPTIRELAGADWDRRLAYLEAAPAADFTKEFAALLADDPSLEKAAEPCANALLALAESKGESARIAPLLERDARLRALAWRTLARLKADAQDFQGATELALAHLQIAVPDLAPPALAAAEVEFARQPTSVVAGYLQFRAQLAAGATDDALRTLQALSALPNCPAYVAYLRGKILAGRAQWDSAWKELAPLLPQPPQSRAAR